MTAFLALTKQKNKVTSVNTSIFSRFNFFNVRKFDSKRKLRTAARHRQPEIGRRFDQRQLGKQSIRSARTFRRVSGRFYKKSGRRHRACAKSIRKTAENLSSPAAATARSTKSPTAFCKAAKISRWEFCRRERAAIFARL